MEEAILMALESAGMDGAVREEGIMGGVWVSGYVCFRGFHVDLYRNEKTTGFYKIRPIIKDMDL